jgi:type I restriction enzyme S subunit
LNYSDLTESITGVTVPKLNQEKMRAICLPIPSLKEQRDIVAILDSLSDKVKALQDNYDQTINLCNDLKQALLKSIFE